MSRAVIQAGGKGTRLYPYTCVLPKPLMPVGEEPILEIVIRQLVSQGFQRITITIGHLGHLIMAVIGDGSRWGAQIDYSFEDEPRGTIGAIRQVKDLNEPFIVMNGDLLTDFNYRSFFDDHLKNGCHLSIGVYDKPVPISLGVLDLDEHQRIVGFREKPTLKFPCSMGIYAFQPELISLVPERGIFGFDTLMALCLERKISTHATLFDGLWLDIGRPEDYADATRLFEQNRHRFLPGPVLSEKL